MGIYGKAAVGAVELFVQGGLASPEEAWNRAIEKETKSCESRKKSCPRNAFLGLCEEGLIEGIPPGSYTDSVLNKKYALLAIDLLRQNSVLASSSMGLWRAVMAGEEKVPNSQLDVVIGLWKD